MEHTSYNQWFGGILTGKSLTGVRMEDMKRIINFLKNELGSNPKNLYAIGRDVLASDLLHFTAVTDEIGRIALINPLVSYIDLVLNDTYHPKYIQSAVPGSVQFYDLPDLASLLAPKKLLFVDVCDQDGNILQDLSSNGNIRFIKDAYSAENNLPNFQLKYSLNQNFEDIYSTWLE
jgi:hypothetical protein